MQSSPLESPHKSTNVPYCLGPLRGICSDIDVKSIDGGTLALQLTDSLGKLDQLQEL